MPRKYVRKTERQNWSEMSMKKAILDVTNGVCGFRKAAQVYEVPKSTLEYRLKKYREEKDLDEAARKSLGRFRTVFRLEDEKIIIEHIRYLDQRLFTLTPRDIRSLAYEMAVKCKLHHSFNDEAKLAGKDWYYSFTNRHGNLTQKSIERTPSYFFDILEKIIDNDNIAPSRIYNVSNVGITTAGNNRSEIFLTRKIKHIASSCVTRGEQVTTILCFSSTGHYIPPFFIFPRVRMKTELLVGFPPESVVICHPTGLIQTEIFVEWLQHFITQVQPSRDKPVLLLLNGQSIYTKNLEFLELARDNGVMLLSFPPDSIHKLQPFDVSLAVSLTSYYTQEVDTWLNEHPECVVTQYQVAELFSTAYLKAASQFNAVMGFKSTGVWPLNRNIHADNAIATSEMTWPLTQSDMDLTIVKQEDDYDS